MAVIVDDKSPREVWEPQTVSEAADGVRFAADRGLALLPLGNGTKRHIGLPPTRYDVALVTRKLTGIVEYSPEDLVVTVRAGMTLSEVQEVLREHRQFLPLDPPFPGKATIGGILATAMTGPCRCLYGAVREHVLGLRVIQPDGTVTRFGGKVVKNVAGYDMTKLYIGSFGTLGVIVEATLKVRPLPEAQGALALSSDDLSAMESFLTALVFSDVTPAYAELVTKPVLESLPVSLSVSHQYTLFLGFEGFQEEITWWLGEAEGLAKGAGLTVGNRFLGEGEGKLRACLRDFHAGEEAVLVLKALLPSSEACSFVKEAEKVGTNRVTAIAHVLNGFVRLFVSSAEEAVPLEVVTALLNWAGERGGNLIVEKAPPDWKPRLPIWGRRDNSWILMRRLKETIDPKGLFAPGRMGW